MPISASGTARKTALAAHVRLPTGPAPGRQPAGAAGLEVFPQRFQGLASDGGPPLLPPLPITRIALASGFRESRFSPASSSRRPGVSQRRYSAARLRICRNRLPGEFASRGSASSSKSAIWRSARMGDVVNRVGRDVTPGDQPVEEGLDVPGLSLHGGG